VWDGRIRLFSPATGKIYLGLLSYVRRFLAENGHKIEYGEGLVPPRRLDKNLTKKFVRKIEKGIRTRDYQIDAIHNILECDRGLILSPTGSGKSFIIYALVRYYIEKLEDKKILIVVPSTGLVEQMYSDFADYGWFPDEYCHKLYAGADKNTPKEVIISTWQSIYNLPKSYFSQFGTVFVDEAHLAKAKSLTGIMTKLHDCKYRIGLTGTLDGTEIHRLVLEGLFNKHKQVTTTSELIRRKQLSDLHISCLVLNHPKDKRNRFNYQEESSLLAVDPARNKFIANLVKDQEGNSLVLCRFIVQLDHLYEMLNKDVLRKVFMIYGGTDTEDRNEIRGIVEKENNAIIIASYGVFSQGINIKRLHNIIFGSPYKSQIKVLQSIGRGLRVAEDKKQLKVFDIVDDLSYNGRENYTLKHFKERITIYNEQSFEYDIIPVKLKK
jgi:superfamily II DNA or RNA helicase